jgi:prepilin-type N-terminal cleavage/methylation domain-containing protein
MNKRSGIDGCETNAGKTGRAFTLLELMVVISIIMILALLALPAINRVREKARVERTRVMCFQVAAACRDYMLQYGKWPDMRGAPLGGCGSAELPGRVVDAALVDILRGGDNASGSIACQNEGNPKRTVFMEISPKLLDTSGRMVDAWGNPIYVKFDVDFNNFVDVTGAGTLNLSVVSWSPGRDGNNDTWTDNVITW